MSIPASIPAPLKEMYEAAKAARENSYSPYSQRKVGASIRDADGKIYSGCNIENSSYGGTTCAEQTAILKAVSEKGHLKIREVVVVTDATPPWPPCGICRQVIAEFAENRGADLVVHAANLKGDVNSLKFSELFPDAFTPSHLK